MPDQDQISQYYSYLKSSGADVAPSLESFKNTLSDEKTAKQYYSYLRNNKFDAPDTFDSFSNTLGLKKKDGGTLSPTELPASSPSQLPKSSTSRLIVTPLAYADDGQKAAVVQPTTITEKLFGNVRPEKQQLDVTPKVRNVEKEIEAEQVGKKITSDAIKNTLKAYKDRLSGDGAYKISDTDPALINQKNDLEKDLKEGNLQVVKSQKTGQYILARKNGALQSISQAYNNVKEKEADDKYVASLSTIDKIKHFDNKAALVKDEYLPSQPSGFGGAFGTLIGENATPLVKMGAMATAAGKVGQYLGLTGTALANAEKFGSFLAFANDAGYSGYANNTEKVYNALRKQNPNGDKIDQMQHAERAGLVGEVSGIATAGAMTGAFAKLSNAAKNVNVKPLVSSLEQLAHHTVKESAIQGGFAAGGSLISDLGAISQGVKMKPSEVAGNAFEAGKGMAEFTSVMGSAMGIVAGLANVPKYVKAQATGTLAKLDPVLVNDAYKEAEANGALDPGTAEKAMQQINGFKEAQKKVPADLPDENVNAISGIQQKIDKLEAQKKTLAPQFHDRIDAVIDSLRNRSKEIASSDRPLEKEVDDITQQPTNVKIESAVAGEKPNPEKVKVLGKDVNFYNDYIPSKSEDIEPKAMYTFNADSKEGIPSLLHDIAYANKREVNGVKTENWHASISGDDLLKLYPEKPIVEEVKPTEVKSNKDVSKVFDMLLKDKDGAEDYGIHGLLADLYGGAEYNEDNGKITLNETRSGTGKMSITKKEFINDILSGKAEKEIPDAKEYINKVKQSIHDELGIKPEITKEEVKPTEVSGIVATEDAFPVSELNKIPKGKLHKTEESQNKLKEDISKNGIKEPLTLVYYVKDNALRLKEGHHRLDAANKLRLQDVPIKVQVEWNNSIKEDRDIQGQELYQPPVPLDIESYEKRNYQPTNIKLSELGFKEKSVQDEVKPTEVKGSIGVDVEAKKAEINKRYDEEVSEYETKIKQLEEDIAANKKGIYLPSKNKQKEAIADINENRQIELEDFESQQKAVEQSLKETTKEEFKPTEVKETIKTKENAIQEPSASSVLQYSQEGARETGGERGRVEPSKQGEAIAEKSKQVEGNEEEVKPKEYTSKTGRQKIVYDEKGNSKVIDTKTGKEVSRETAKKVFNEAADNYDFSKGKKASFEGAELKDEREVENYTIDNSSNPAEIAEVYARQELEPPSLNSAEAAIVNHGIGKVDVKSFKRFNDENNITFGLAKNWFQKGGKGSKLDVIAEEISAKTGVNVTPEDIGNFMVRFPSGARAEKLVENDIAYNAREKFEKLTGLPLTEEIAHKAIDYEFNKLTKEQQAIAEQDFKTRKQLEDAYWAEQPGAVKPAPEKGDNIAAKQATKAEKGLKEPIVEKKPLEGIQQEYQEVINKTGERVREKAKLEFVERNFDSILDKLKEKIKEKCPT